MTAHSECGIRRQVAGHWVPHSYGTPDIVLSVAISSDGKRIVSGSFDTGEAVGAPLLRHISMVLFVANSLDGKYIVSGSHDTTHTPSGGCRDWRGIGCPTPRT
jgi:hypothetical protein